MSTESFTKAIATARTVVEQDDEGRFVGDESLPEIARALLAAIDALGTADTTLGELHERCDNAVAKAHQAAVARDEAKLEWLPPEWYWSPSSTTVRACHVHTGAFVEPSSGSSIRGIGQIPASITRAVNTRDARLRAQKRD